MNYLKNLFLSIFFLLALMAFSTEAYALTINLAADPSTFTLVEDGTLLCQWQSAESTAYFTTLGINIVQDKLYKDEINSEEGIFKNNYVASNWLGGTGGESGVTISHTGGSFIDNAEYLFVKDGVVPWWYLFDITGWNGIDDIVLQNFWDDPDTTANESGAISHVSIYGTSSPGTLVPEPATMMLLGFGLIGLAGVSRKKFVK